MRIAAGPDHRMLVPASGLAAACCWRWRMCGGTMAAPEVPVGHYLAAGRALPTCCTGGVSTDERLGPGYESELCLSVNNHSGSRLMDEHTHTQVANAAA